LSQRFDLRFDIEPTFFAIAALRPVERCAQKLMDNKIPISSCLLRGALRRCPQCGKGHLFQSYLKRREFCEHCGEPFDGLEAEDGPAWLTIALTAHLVIPLLILLESKTSLSYGVESFILCLFTIICVSLILPIAKGVFISFLWLMRKNRV